MIKIRNISVVLLIAAILTTMTSCGADASMRAEVTIEGLGTQNVRIIYTDDKAVNTATVTAIDSKFNFEAVATEETLFEIYSNARTLLGRFVATNGDNISLTLKASDPTYMKISGNKTSEQLARFLSENNGNTDLNDAIARQVEKNPEQMLSAILMTFYYDFSGDTGEGARLTDMLTARTSFSALTRGNSRMLARLAEPQEKVGPIRLVSQADTARTFMPDTLCPTLIWFDDGSAGINDSICESLDSIGTGRFKAAHILVSTDTFGWRRSTSKLPKAVNRLFAPGGIASPGIYPLVITDLPFFIVTDTAAAQIYRGCSIHAALDSVRNLLKTYDKK